MKYINKFGILALMLFAATSCVNEDKAPIVTFDSANHGAYVRLVSESSRLVNLFDIAGSSYAYSVEFVDDEMGKNVMEYSFDLQFRDVNPDNGDESRIITGYRTFAASTFTTNDDGFQSLSDISLPAAELIADLEITEADIEPGDEFLIIGSLLLEGGFVAKAETSSSAVNGSSFRAHTTFALTASCPSDLDGEINWEIIAANWDVEDATGTFDMIQMADGVYTWGTYTFGFYQWIYGCCEQGASNVQKITDVCNKLTLSTSDDYGCSHAMTVNSVVGPVLTVLLQHGCGGGEETIELTRADGVTWEVDPAL